MRPHVLVVEDDPDLRTLVEFALSEHFEVSTAVDGADAIARLSAEGVSFDAVVTDLSMPNKDGYHVLEHVRDSPSIAELPVLVMTARDDRDSRRDSYVSGGHAFLAKPFDPDQLVKALRELLRRSPEARRLGRMRGVMDPGE